MDPPPNAKFLWLFGGSEVCLFDSATATQLCRRFHQNAHCVCRCPDSGRLSTVPNFTSSLWMHFFVQPLSINSVITTERCNLCVHTDFWSKFSLFLLNGIKINALLNTASKLALFSVSDLKDEKLLKSKPTWKLKHAISILETFAYFCKISSKSVLKISSYTVSKSGRFFETQCIITAILTIVNFWHKKFIETIIVN